MAYKIIIVEDDKEIREELSILLKNVGYEVELITDFSTVNDDMNEKNNKKTNLNIEDQILSKDAHLILLDINLPNKNGYEICKKIRAKSKVPIIFVTSRNNTIDELNGIMLGGDDYIEKPYNIPILLARIQNLLNRVYSNKNQESKIEYKNIVLDVLKSTVTYNSHEIELTKTELKTLYYLFKNKDKIVSRNEIIDYLWDNQVYADDNNLSVIITRLREKLKDLGVEDLIETKRGLGYKI